MKKTELYFNLLLIPLDILMVLASFVLAYFLRAQEELVPLYGSLWSFPDYLKFISIFIPFWIIVFALGGMYNLRRKGRGLGEFANVFINVSAGIMVIVGYIFLSKSTFFSRLIIAYSWILAIILVTLGRSTLKGIQRLLYSWDIGTHRIIIIGNGLQANELARDLNENKKLGYRIIGSIGSSEVSGVKYLGMLEDYEKILQKQKPDDVFVINGKTSQGTALEIMGFCYQNNMGFKMAANAFEIQSKNIELFTLAGIPIVNYRRTSLDGWAKVIKRFIDLIFSTVGLIILSPVFFLLAILIKLDSRGPVFFCQDRVGLGRNFKVFKFRSMKQDAEKEHAEMIKKYGNMFKLKDDPRVTRLGKFLRKTSLDEIPQLINVFLGQMSLVGPRPPMPIEVEQYTPWQRQRLGIKPGLTGLWQVSGRSNLSFDEWVKLDVYYIENWSLLLDLKIIFKTFVVVLLGKGAY